MKKAIALTRQGKTDLETELEALKARRPIIAERLATARAFGDLSENQEYSDARSEQRTIENRILEIEDILKNARLIRTAARSKIGIGATVEIKLSGKTHTYTIVGPVEADPAKNRISDASPLGQALLGRAAGEKFTLANGRAGQIISVK